MSIAIEERGNTYTFARQVQDWVTAALPALAVLGLAAASFGDLARPLNAEVLNEMGNRVTGSLTPSPSPDPFATAVFSENLRDIATSPSGTIIAEGFQQAA